MPHVRLHAAPRKPIAVAVAVTAGLPVMAPDGSSTSGAEREVAAAASGGHGRHREVRVLVGRRARRGFSSQA